MCLVQRNRIKHIIMKRMNKMFDKMKMIRCFVFCVVVADFIFVANGCQSIAALVDFASNQGIYKIWNLHNNKLYIFPWNLIYYNIWPLVSSLRSYFYSFLFWRYKKSRRNWNWLRRNMQAMSFWYGFSIQLLL